MTTPNKLEIVLGCIGLASFFTGVVGTASYQYYANAYRNETKVNEHLLYGLALKVGGAMLAGRAAGLYIKRKRSEQSRSR